MKKQLLVALFCTALLTGCIDTVEDINAYEDITSEQETTAEIQGVPETQVELE